MPLARLQLRNEYGLGVKELYREPSEIEDPKLVLDGVAVAGLVGLLRQLGDLAEFAAEVFHGLQEELTTTASKSRKLISRVKRVEAALPPIEKAILSQTSHIHFSYAPGSNWHPRIRNEQNHFIYNYLPRCIMDPYEECREPPRLQLLDKFDAGGPGSCLKRYSDPTFFRKVSGNSDINDEKYHKGRKSRKSKRRRARKRSSQLPFSAPNFDSSDRPKVSFSSKPQQFSPVHTSSTYDVTVKSDLVVQPGSPSSGDGMGFIECVFSPSTSVPDKTKIDLPLSVLDSRISSSPDSDNVDDQTSDNYDDVQENSTLEKTSHHTSSVTWVSMLGNGMMNSPDSNYVDAQSLDTHDNVQESSKLEKNTYHASSVTWVSMLDSRMMNSPDSNYIDEQTSDTLDDVEESSKLEKNTHHASSVTRVSMVDNGKMNSPDSNFIDEQTSDTHDTVQESSTLEKNTHHTSSVTWDEKVEIIEPMVLFSGVQDLPTLHDTNSEFDKQDIVPSIWKSVDDEATEVNNPYFDYDEPDIEPMKLTFGSYEPTDVHSTGFQLNLENGPTDRTFGRNEISEVCENFEPADLEPVTSGQISWDNGISQVYPEYYQHESPEYDHPVGREIVDFVGKSHMADSTNVTLDKNQPDDIESENDNFMDALNTIESDSEKDFDHQTSREVVPYTHLQDDLDYKSIAAKNDDHLLELESPSSAYQDFNKKCFNTSQGPTCSLLSTCEESFQHSPASLDASKKEVSVHADDLVSPLELADKAPLQAMPSSSIQHVSCRSDSGIPDDITATLQQQSDLGDSLSEYRETDMIAETDKGSICFPVPEQDPDMPDDITNCLHEQSYHHESLSESRETDMIAETNKGSVCFLPEQAPVGYCNVSSVALWTNGNLLGLQPSKPPDFKTSDCPGSSTANPSCDSQSLIPKDDDFQGKLDLSHSQLDSEYTIANSYEPTSESNAHEIGFSKEIPQHSNSGFGEKLAMQIELNKINHMPSLTHPETQHPSASEVRARSNGTVHVNDYGSISSGFRHGLLSNSLQTARSAQKDEEPITACSDKAHDFENSASGTSHHSFEGTDMKKLMSPVNSPPPSPPLEHMKISFQPLNSFEIRKLKLNYPEEIDHHDENVNVYPSFQLVPEPNHLHRTTVSDSDDDTFCRSNPCMSDDDLSYLSDSVWGSEDSLESLDGRPYNGLQRISYDELVSCSGEQGKIPTKRMLNVFESSELEYKIGVSHASSRPISGIPVLNVINSISEAPNRRAASDYLSDTVLAGTKSPPFNDFSSFYLCKNSQSAFAQLPNLEPDRLDHTRTGDINVITRNQQLHQEKKNSLTPDAGRSVDDNGDFLQQIRATSFNLRKTGLLTPTCTSIPCTNVNVTAILQKASAIRKVVASDGEDTEPWSYT